MLAVGSRIMLLVLYLLQLMLFPNAMTLLVPIVVILVRAVMLWRKDPYSFKAADGVSVTAKGDGTYILASVMMVYSAIFFILYTTQ